MSLYSAEPIFRIRAELGEMQHFGQTPYGERRVIDITGGTVEGPRVNGRILPGGADWQIVRADGVIDLDARYTIECEGGGLLAELGEAVARGLPVIVCVPLRFRAAWAEFAGGLDVELPPRSAALADWWARARLAPAIS